MKKFSVRLIAMLLALMMVMSMTSCSIVSRLLGGGDSSRRDHDRYEDEEDDEDDDDEDDGDDEDDDKQGGGLKPSGGTKTDDLTYPDHVATLDEVHPARTRGNITGTQAKELLSQVEMEYITHFVTSYIDICIIFEHPENFGLEADDVTMGEATLDPEAERDFVLQELNKLYTIDEESLDHQDRICYDKMVWDLEEEAYQDKYTAFRYYESILNPLTGPQCDFLFIMDIMPITTADEAENMITLLEDVDRYYDDICEFEEERAAYGFASSDDIYEQIAESFDSLVEMTDDCFLYDHFEEKVNAIPGLSSAEKADLISGLHDALHDVVFPEFQECADRMRGLKGSGGHDSALTAIPGGDDYYASICRHLSNSSKSVDQLAQDLDTVLTSITNTYFGIAYGADRSWQSGYLSHSYSSGDTEQNIAYLKNKIFADFPALHDHSYSLSEVPEALEENFSPAAYLGYHLDNYDSNLIIVNNSNVDEDFGITIAHEAYPGHMFQSVYTRSISDHPYMYLYDSIGYAEGWAEYTELYSMKYYDDNETVRTLVKIEDELNVLTMARCDIGIHWEGWDLQDCATYFSNLMRRTISASDIQDMYDLLISDPGYAVKYGNGFVNTGLIIQAAHDRFPDATDLQIHTAYLNANTGTFEQIEANMMAELEG